MNKHIKSKERVKDFAEVFTQDKQVNDMVDELDSTDDTQLYISNPSFTVLEPAVGTGNFLVEIIKRKLENCKNEEDCFLAIQSLYGIDIQLDNVEECRENLRIIMVDHVIDEARLDVILTQNIIHGNFIYQKTEDAKPTIVQYLDGDLTKHVPLMVMNYETNKFEKIESGTFTGGGQMDLFEF